MEQESNIIFESEVDEKMHQLNSKIDRLEHRISELDTYIDNLHIILKRTVSSVNELDQISFAVNDNIQFLYHAVDQKLLSSNNDSHTLSQSSDNTA